MNENIKCQSIYYPKCANLSLVLSLVHFDREAGLGSSSFSSCLWVADLFSILGFDWLTHQKLALALEWKNGGQSKHSL